MILQILTWIMLGIALVCVSISVYYAVLARRVIRQLEEILADYEKAVDKAVAALETLDFLG